MTVNSGGSRVYCGMLGVIYSKARLPHCLHYYLCVFKIPILLYCFNDSFVMHCGGPTLCWLQLPRYSSSFSEASAEEEDQYAWQLHHIWLTGSFESARTSWWTMERENGGWGAEQWLGSLIISRPIQTPILWFQMTSIAGLQKLFGEEKSAITSDI